MLNNKALEIYAKVILHAGCALRQKQGDFMKHSWEECPNREVHLRAARKDQHKLKSNGLAIGIWIDETKYSLVPKAT